MQFIGFTGLIVISLSFIAASPSHSQADLFVTDRASPLKPITLKLSPSMKFKGSVQVSGRFLAVQHQYDKQVPYLQLIFYPDSRSAELLPRLEGDKPVKEVQISNPEQAALMLLDPDTLEKLRRKELPSVTLRATAVIHAYEIAVVCDQRWYMADVVSASTLQDVAGSAEKGRIGCG